MRAARSLAPSIIRPRRLRTKVVLGALVASLAASAVATRLVDRAENQATSDAVRRREQIDEARFIAKKYAHEGFAAWTAAHPGYRCPQHLAELDELIGRHSIDPWGLPFQGYCHVGETFRVVSAGPDRTHGTYDDIIEVP